MFDLDISAFDSFDDVTHIDALAALPMRQLIDSGPVGNYLLDIDRAAAELGEWAAREAAEGQS